MSKVSEACLAADLKGQQIATGGKREDTRSKVCSECIIKIAGALTKDVKSPIVGYLGRLVDISVRKQVQQIADSHALH